MKGFGLCDVRDKNRSERLLTVMSLMMNLSMSIVALLAYIESRQKHKK